MKTRPILFSTPMVQALLAGTKTQTRRIVKPQPVKEPGGLEFRHTDGSFRGWLGDSAGVPGRPKYDMATIWCPYGVPGDRLWVREKWGYRGLSSTNRPERYAATALYHADGAKREVEFPSFEAMTTAVPRQKIVHPPGFSDLPEDERRYAHHDLLEAWWKGKRSIPSIHMPRWASRLTLELTDVRVQRLQEISRGDAMEEGCPFPNMQGGSDPRQWYSELWDTINGAGSWEANPWVWALTFRRVEQP